MSKDLEKQIKELNDKNGKITVDNRGINAKLTKHIGFIDETYEGLRNPN